MPLFMTFTSTMKKQFAHQHEKCRRKKRPRRKACVNTNPAPGALASQPQKRWPFAGFPKLTLKHPTRTFVAPVAAPHQRFRATVPAGLRRCSRADAACYGKANFVLTKGLTYNIPISRLRCRSPLAQKGLHPAREPT